jgi:glutathione synthase/RimK-type ligase-like ATP-grasp enzyme
MPRRARARPSVAVFAPPDDPHASRVARHLASLGADVLWIDLASCGEGGLFSLEDGVPRYHGEDLTRLRSAYVRSVQVRLPFHEVDLAPAERESTPEARARALARRWAGERERLSFLTCFLVALERAGVRVVNPVATLDQHFLKLDQLALLRGAGLPVPRTLATSDPDALARFVEEVGPGRVVYKPLAGGALCRRLERADLAPERLALLARAPVLFQEEARGADLRVFVVGGAVAAAYEVLVAGEGVDFRGRERGVRRVALARPLERACRRAAEACSMAFTGIDLKLAPDRSYVFLEANPSPMFAGFEESAGERGAVSGALARHLVGE